MFGIARHSETEEVFASYRKLYDDYSYWVRPVEIFLGNVERDGYAGPQFRRVAQVASTSPIDRGIRKTQDGTQRAIGLDQYLSAPHAILLRFRYRHHIFITVGDRWSFTTALPRSRQR